MKQKGFPQDSPFGQVGKELPTFESTPFGMKCRFPIAEVDGITIAVLLCETTTTHLGLLLHPAPANQILDPSRNLYYASWAFYNVNENTCSWAKRVIFLGGDLYNLRFRGKPIDARWREICIVTRPPMTMRRRGAHVVLRFLPDIPPTIFRVPRNLLQAMAALKLLPRSQMISSDPASTKTTRLIFENVIPLEVVYILLGACTKASTDARPCHWAWAEHRFRATWDRKPTEYAHDCATDHVEDWPGRLREFGDAERRIHITFAPCPHAAAEQTLVLGVQLSGSVYENMQKDANIRLPTLPLSSPLPVGGALPSNGRTPTQPAGQPQDPTPVPTSPASLQSSSEERTRQLSSELELARADIASLKSLVATLSELVLDRDSSASRLSTTEAQRRSQDLTPLPRGEGS